MLFYIYMTIYICYIMLYYVILSVYIYVMWYMLYISHYIMLCYVMSCSVLYLYVMLYISYVNILCYIMLRYVMLRYIYILYICYVIYICYGIWCYYIIFELPLCCWFPAFYSFSVLQLLLTTSFLPLPSFSLFGHSVKYLLTTVKTSSTLIRTVYSQSATCSAAHTTGVLKS